MPSEPVIALRLGQVDYRAAWELQRSLARARRLDEIPDVVLVLEHPPTFTTGRRGGTHHLRIPLDWLAARGIPYYVTDRGGDVTYHGPGQLVAYVILRLGEGQRRVRRFVEQLEERSSTCWRLTGSREYSTRRIRVSGLVTRRLLPSESRSTTASPITGSP